MENPYKLNRSFVKKDQTINSWEDTREYFNILLKQELNSIADFNDWLKNKSELEAVIDEDFAWKYIRLNTHTENPEYQKDFENFNSNIQPRIIEHNHLLNKKLLSFPKLNKIKDEASKIMIRNIAVEFKLYRKENVELLSQLQNESVQFGTISSQMFIEHHGENFTLQQASNFLKDTNRELRKEIFGKITDRRLLDKEKLDKLLTSLIKKRHTIAQNSGFNNYADYKFTELCRFDYTATDIADFENAIEKHVMPLVANINLRRKNKLGLDKLQPYDLQVDTEQLPALKPFHNTRDLIDKTIVCFNRLHPSLGEYIRFMDEMNFLDLESRKNKAPGGFNYPLYESNVPFIFMNSSGNLRDLTTMVHEGGHAIHSFLTSHLELVDYKSTPSEVAELASMSMELLSMEHWDVFFPDQKDLLRAKIEQLESIIEVLPWVAIIDSFQQKLYQKPNHSENERKVMWLEQLDRFSDKIIDWSDYQEGREYMWQKQMHIFEVPFYYIEYAISQLGAIAIWRNYKKNGPKAIEQYLAALKLGYTKNIPEIYATAGIQFNFSDDYICGLMEFVQEELTKLYAENDKLI